MEARGPRREPSPVQASGQAGSCERSRSFRRRCRHRNTEEYLPAIRPEREQIMSMQYTIIIEKAKNNYSAYAPDLPGCITTGKTIEETSRNMQEAIALHIRGMREDGDPIPEPTTTAAVVEVAA